MFNFSAPMKLASVFSFLVLSSVTHARSCYDLDGLSCWSLENRTSQSVKVSCVHPTGYELFDHSSIQSGETLSEQFDMRYADSLGFPSPNERMVCRLNGSAFTFTSLNYGVNVKMSVDGQSLTVTQTDVYSGRTRQDSFPL
jgi:hypothetical protein